ncbi:hypothetical protein LX32DRAFT_340991 [Colletotrichum zoysiae]|uniref:Uncharacterized protein n=1 Tax=Colletotrichum zoysiae TaxID=1216348 RepID=A0AAD9HV41_9PEZI|nr:hypothetical protein LX32DRAFT_340991 [Colletotrichum zoysiae]
MFFPFFFFLLFRKESQTHTHTHAHLPSEAKSSPSRAAKSNRYLHKRHDGSKAGGRQEGNRAAMSFFFFFIFFFPASPESDQDDGGGDKSRGSVCAAPTCDDAVAPARVAFSSLSLSLLSVSLHPAPPHTPQVQNRTRDELSWPRARETVGRWEVLSLPRGVHTRRFAVLRGPL